MEVYQKEIKFRRIQKIKKNIFNRKNTPDIHQDETVAISITICSLQSNIGCSNIAKTLAYFIKHYLKKTVCIIDITGINTVTEINGIEVFNKSRLYDLYDRYNYIVIDIGKYYMIFQREIKRSKIKIMVALLDEHYLNSLAIFTKDEESAKKWKYIFNQVRKNKQKKVDDLMEDYEYWCMPINDAKIFDKKMCKKLHRLVIGGKL